MSADTVALDSSRAPTYDFSQDSTRFYGVDGCVDMRGSGLWGLWAGDADGSGAVDGSDDDAVWSGRNTIGYLNTDCELNGIVNARDRSLAYNNHGRATAVP